MMHIIKNFFEKLTFNLFSGSRVPVWSDAKHPMPSESDDDYDEKLARYEVARARWELAVKQNKKCIFPKYDQELVDKRVKYLVGPANWIKNSMVCVYTYVNYIYTVCLHSVYIMYTICKHVRVCELHTYIMHTLCTHFTSMYVYI